ncbi:MAG: hypothetical protein M1816_003604 [Peltula sp. TS41687]|nr:MAG: hypothetical protein M1816_003604 [Peltula sp. TS41687]
MSSTDPKPKRRQTTEAERAAIWALRRAGFSYGEISKREGHARSTVRSVCQRAEQHPDAPLKLKPRSGRPPKIHEPALGTNASLQNHGAKGARKKRYRPTPRKKKPSIPVETST